MIARRDSSLLCRLVLAWATLAATAATAVAQTGQPPELHTHQAYMEEVMRQTKLDVNDPMAVFAFILNSLPDRVKVYPTENYFYFRFTHDGSPYAGNIRLDASTRDQGKVDFAYYENTSGWRDETPGHYTVLDASHGVKLEKLERFAYRLTYGGKSVVFELNDLSQVKPPKNAMGEHESFIGPSFDDSGLRFFLIFNAAIKNFLFVLDETVKEPEQFFSPPRRDRILVGKRTGFAFYRDHRLDRKILIGVYEANSRVNNYFDGPFDQLPDNFIEGETLRDAILQVEPGLKGQIDRFGGSPDGEIRYMIAPYMEYREVSDLNRINACATRRHRAAAAYYRCFVTAQEPQPRLDSGGAKPKRPR